jgi:hypothetical protein
MAYSFLINVNTPGYSPLGKGLKGFIPNAVLTTDLDYADAEQQRFQLVEAWNNVYKRQLKGSPSNIHGAAATPFRIVNNSGDILSRKYYSCGGSSQTFQSRPGMYGLRGKFGAIQSLCDGTEIPPASCNTKYVYDSSDYSTYLKQKALSKNYNDLSYGGNKYSGAQSKWRAVRRY